LNCSKSSVEELNAQPCIGVHLGFGKSISRSNLAEANEKRDCKIFEMFAYEMIAEAQKTCISDSDFNLSIKGNVYAFDSTTIVSLSQCFLVGKL